MRTELFKWLSWIVIGFALCAGFAARANDNNPVIIVKKSNGVVKCQIYSSFASGDSRLSAREFDSHKECEESAAFSHFNGKNSNADKKKPEEVDVLPEEYPKIAKYIKIFEAKTKIPTGITKISLGITKKNVLGYCNMKTRQIVISKKFWESNRSELVKEMTVYHELAHCVLNRGHFNIKTKMFNVKGQNKLCPLSIMYKSAWTPQDTYRCFHQHRDYYFEELRAGSFIFQAQKNGKKDKIIQSWYLFHEKFTIKVGPFSCTATRGKNYSIKDSNYIFHISRIKCTRDQVIFSEVWKVFRTATGKGAVHNLSTKVQSQQGLRIILHDTILNEKYTVFLSKISFDLW